MIIKNNSRCQGSTVFLNQLADKLTKKDTLGVGLGVGVGQGVEPHGCKKIRVRGLGSVGEEREERGRAARSEEERTRRGAAGPPKKTKWTSDPKAPPPQDLLA